MEDNTNNTELQTPKEINEINGDFIARYCKSKGQEGEAWLKGIYARPKTTDKNGIEREISFLQVRNEFAREYFPHLAPKGKKKKSVLDKFNEL